MTKYLKVLLVLLLILQLIVAASFELSHDEAYYWLFSRHLDFGYMDHPPFMAVLIWLFSFLPHSEFAVRVGFVLSQFATVLILLRMVKPENQLRATLMFFAFPLASLSGLLALPDMPLLLMTAAYCYGLKLYLADRRMAAPLGVVIGLLLWAKYHGILLVFFTLLALPRLFKERSFYLTAGIAVMVFLPHMVWQYQHDFTTLRYHFLERPKSDFSVKRLLEFAGTQVVLAGLIAGPIVWWCAARIPARDPFLRALKSISFGTVGFFLISTVSKKFEANWTIFLAIPLILLTVDNGIWNKKFPKYLLCFMFALMISFRMMVFADPGPKALKRLREVHLWERWSRDVQKLCDSKPIVANTYQIASKLSFYLEAEIHALNYHSRRNQFDIWRWDLKKPIKDVCYLTDKGEFEGETILTPEGKTLIVATKYPYEELLTRKSQSM